MDGLPICTADLGIGTFIGVIRHCCNFCHLAAVLLLTTIVKMDLIMTNKYEYYDLTCRLSKENLYNLLYALVMHSGAITDTSVIGLNTIKSLTRHQNSYSMADFRIQLPSNQRKSFEDMSSLELVDIPKVSINSEFSQILE